MKKFTLLILINLLLELISIPIVTASQTTRVIFSTRSGYYLNCYDSKGVCQAQPTYSNNPAISDEIFTLIDLNGRYLMNGDKIMLKMRTGYYINSYDSAGVIQAQPTYSDDPNVSDEIFTVYKVRGSSGGNQIKSGDKIMIKTRRNYAFNCYDSRGTCKAIPTFSDDYRISDEVFTIRFL
ncbi:MAG: hypothetical protein EWV75_07450 [Microcystis wesenbergii Mw_QC_S_20081001_S30D]|jgi:hypothetical protein|uniref:Uncharacterized protein n=2 Tax=Microcystis TaxID=1125 RepID=A0A552DCV6_MICAE|nr:hypothetical protein [Microcystis aeruginosa W11-03]NCR15488.1 hypothetical protein [Microcystis aeruginosa SX13-11]NCR17381.1 hypothetical protein [Microcystis aeruginosa LL13-03]NCR46680.1 hypothetical protein [Microcystis aeruginosa SX13-01]NCR69318.1 hypothetical protein [Microcystis aeruginosa LL11-07]NCR94420.1 hypothetical protein [Microcystis aeruginosa W11-06]NCS18269.1 hypothetical protein [Microcystis aeruginosa G13-12]NCS22378.1 hypothetical protein [Microcystis aeruginosa G11